MATNSIKTNKIQDIIKLKIVKDNFLTIIDNTILN
jgi:hypothetical protein